MMDLVRVKWLDATQFAGWQSHGAAEVLEPDECESVGWLVAETETTCVLAGSCDPNDHDEEVSSVQVIPQVCILSIRKIKSK